MTNLASARVGTNFRPPHLAYKRRTAPGPYLDYPQNSRSTRIHKFSVSPSRAPLHMHEGIDRQRRNGLTTTTMMYSTNLSTESDQPQQVVPPLLKGVVFEVAGESNTGNGTACNHTVAAGRSCQARVSRSAESRSPV
jgi:hypothetical protein